MKTIIFLLLSLTIMAFKEEMRIVPVGYEKYGETVYYSSSKNTTVTAGSNMILFLHYLI